MEPFSPQDIVDCTAKLGLASFLADLSCIDIFLQRQKILCIFFSVQDFCNICIANDFLVFIKIALADKSFALHLDIGWHAFERFIPSSIFAPIEDNVVRTVFVCDLSVEPADKGIRALTDFLFFFSVVAFDDGRHFDSIHKLVRLDLLLDVFRHKVKERAIDDRTRFIEEGVKLCN